MRFAKILRMPLNGLLGALNKRKEERREIRSKLRSDCRTTSEPWLIASNRSVPQVPRTCLEGQRRGFAAAVQLLGKVMKIKALRLTFFVVSDHQIGHRLGGGGFGLGVGLLLALLLL